MDSRIMTQEELVRELAALALCGMPKTTSRVKDHIAAITEQRDALLKDLTRIATTYNSNPCCILNIDGKDTQHHEWCHRGIAQEAVRRCEEGK